jgi:CheY-like chemotaxis protein
MFVRLRTEVIWDVKQNQASIRLLPCLDHSWFVTLMASSPSDHTPTARERAQVGTHSLDQRRALRILVVDDLKDAADALAILLRMHGHALRTIYEGQTALATALEFNPHVILLDIGLPLLSGYQVAKQLRQHTELQSVCLIALSGYGQPEDVQAAKQAGFDFHLLKPIEPHVLLPILDGVKT